MTHHKMNILGLFFSVVLIHELRSFLLDFITGFGDTLYILFKLSIIAIFSFRAWLSVIAIHFLVCTLYQRLIHNIIPRYFVCTTSSM